MSRYFDSPKPTQGTGPSSLSAWEAVEPRNAVSPRSNLAWFALTQPTEDLTRRREAEGKGNPFVESATSETIPHISSSGFPPRHRVRSSLLFSSCGLSSAVNPAVPSPRSERPARGAISDEIPPLPKTVRPWHRISRFKKEIAPFQNIKTSQSNTLIEMLAWSRNNQPVMAHPASTHLASLQS